MRSLNARNAKEVATDINVADTTWQRLKGLLGRKSLSRQEGLWIKPCRAVHTLGMRFPIDVIFLDKKNFVIAIAEAVQPNRFPPFHPCAYSVVELATGRIAETETCCGDLLLMESAHHAPVAHAGPASPVPENRMRKQGFRGCRCPDTRQVLSPMVCSLCLHLIMVTALAAERQSRPEVVWVSTLLTAGSTLVDFGIDVRPPSHLSDREVPAQSDEVGQKTDRTDQQEQQKPVEQTAVATEVGGRAVQVANIASNAVPQRSLEDIPDAVAAMPMAQFSSASLPGQYRPPMPVNVVHNQPVSLPALASVPGYYRQPVPVISVQPRPASVPAMPLQQLRLAGAPSSTASRIMPDPVGLVTTAAPVIKDDTENLPGILQQSSSSVLPEVSQHMQGAPEITTAAVTQPLEARQTVASPSQAASDWSRPPAEKMETASKEKPRQAPPALEGPLTGDLELFVTGSGITSHTKIMVFFRPYPKHRHNVPMSIRESRRCKTIIPKTSHTGENTVQAVIEEVSDGIYEFRGTENNDSHEASCTLTIRGTSGRPTAKTLGTRNLGNNSYILRVMMPEGVLWDDESNFTGSIKDSDGITKFNSDTGLVWKEYM